MPPKKRTHASTQKDQCCVCCQTIAKGKDESLFCAGDCQQWLHRYCPRVLRFKGDMEKVVSSLSDLDSSIGYQSIKDVYRLGRFSSDKKKPRLLLVKFIRAADVSTILSKRGSLQNSLVSIKPDMSPLE